MRSARLISRFMRASLQEEAAYRANFFISIFYSLLNLAAGLLGVFVLFSQVEQIRGWSFTSTLALLGTYLTVSAIRGLFIGPGFDALAGMDGEIWSGAFDYTVLRPLNIQFYVSLRKWRWFALFDLMLGFGVLILAAVRMGQTLSLGQVALFCIAMAAGVLTLYAILLAFAGLVFWSPEVLFTWLFNGVFQMARYPVGMYPGWLRLVLTWVIPVGVITTLPAQALTGEISPWALVGACVLAVLLTVGASALFLAGLRRYASASS